MKQVSIIKPVKQAAGFEPGTHTSNYQQSEPPTELTHADFFSQTTRLKIGITFRQDIYTNSVNTYIVKNVKKKKSEMSCY